MKVKTFSKKHGTCDISFEIHLEFPRLSSLGEGGTFKIRNLSPDANKCFPSPVAGSDINALSSDLLKKVDDYIARSNIESATKKKLIYICYDSELLGDESYVGMKLSFQVLDTLWSGDVLVKAFTGDNEIAIKNNYPVNVLSASTIQVVDWSQEKEDFLKDVVSKVHQVEKKLSDFFTNDIFTKGPSIEDKFKLVMGSTQKLIS